jgi:glycosyltransferase involved in cell wall biosynthesis
MPEDRGDPVKKHKILFVAHSMRYAGAEKVLLKILENLDRNVLIPYVACPEGPMLKEIHPLCEEVLILREGVVPVLFRPLDYLNSAFRLAVSLLPNTLATMKFIKQKKIDLVFSNTGVIFHGMLAARIRGVPGIVMIHEIVSPRFVGTVVTKLASLLNDKAIAVSNAILKSYLTFGGDRSKSARINCAIDLSEFDGPPTEPSPDRYGIGEKTFAVGLVGNLTPRKGHVHFIKMAAEVLKELKNVRFLIVGDFKSNPPYHRQLLALVHDLNLGDSMTFTGAIPNLASTSLFRRLDVLAVSSVMETLSLATLEAMALKKPVVAFDVGGVGEAVVDHVTGRLVPFGDHMAMARAVVEILQNPEMAKRMGEEGRKKVERDFSLGTQTRQLHELFLSVLSPSKPL